MRSGGRYLFSEERDGLLETVKNPLHWETLYEANRKDIRRMAYGTIREDESKVPKTRYGALPPEKVEGFEQELLTLPGDYAAPRGALFLATVDGLVAGCCALRPLDASDYANASEMKRLYVRNAFRGFGLGRELASHTLDVARQAGYSHVLLDTLDEMETARSLYFELGFEEIPPYYHNPIAGAHYLKVDL
jgi:ribosomal protein S18 acetylase RimI-like enzyme